MTYKEYIYNLCTDCDFENKEDAVMLCKVLSCEALRYHELAMLQEDKLTELLTAKEMKEVARETAKKILQFDMGMMAESEFKDFLKEHFDEITADEESFNKFMEELSEKEDEQ